MKNKHQIFFLVFFVPTFGEGGGGGGPSRWGQNPKFGRNFFWTAPLSLLPFKYISDMYHTHKYLGWVPKAQYLKSIRS